MYNSEFAVYSYDEETKRAVTCGAYSGHEQQVGYVFVTEVGVFGACEEFI